MAAPEVAIRRLATRIRAPEPEGAFAARALLDQALRRMGPGVDAALERAGLPPDAVVALPRLQLRLHLQGEVSAAELGEAWASALAQAILSALPATRDAAAQQDAPGVAEAENPASFRDLWAAEMAVLRALAQGEPAPWWTTELIGDAAGSAEDVLADILARWIARDPARAAWRMSDVLTQLPALAARLEARPAQVLAFRLLNSAQAALQTVAPAVSGPPESGMAAPLRATPAARDAAARHIALLPASLRIALALMSPAQRLPWLAAALLKHAPAQAAHLAALLETATALPLSMPHAQHAGDGVVPAPKPERLAEAAETEATEVWCGGLLLLIRPLARLRPAWLSLGEALPERLLALGLVALQRLAAPLPPAACRAALERDRPLLALFAGAPPPDEPLDAVRAAPSLAVEAEDALAALLAAAPSGTAHAPAALRRAYGRDPFAADAATDALCRLLLRPGRLLLEEGAATLVWPPDAADIALRRAGWDIDPGWVPWLGRRIAFRYGA
ncbi:contractile injection system tape measure protein [Falsiroseomonas bella]|uniref:contractile injection system tape measure protein n=1 Tax=Falsiroseomonas bella TaxID=2184016 RepID=UPI001304FEDA|nr:contractile injection system tape measure protein [Falsiroseomonas bella]